jgi:hypothetical protein
LASSLIHVRTVILCSGRRSFKSRGGAPFLLNDLLI